MALSSETKLFIAVALIVFVVVTLILVCCVSYTGCWLREKILGNAGRGYTKFEAEDSARAIAFDDSIVDEKKSFWSQFGRDSSGVMRGSFLSGGGIPSSDGISDSDANNNNNNNNNSKKKRPSKGLKSKLRRKSESLDSTTQSEEDSSKEESRSGLSTQSLVDRGSLAFKLFYDPVKEILTVDLKSAKNLTGRAISGTSNPYIRLLVLNENARRSFSLKRRRSVRSAGKKISWSENLPKMTLNSGDDGEAEKNEAFTLATRKGPGFRSASTGSLRFKPRTRKKEQRNEDEKFSPLTSPPIFQTHVYKKNPSPQIDETFSVPVAKTEFSSSQLIIYACDYHKSCHHDVTGQVTVNLRDVDVGKILEKKEDFKKPKKCDIGDVLISLNYLPTAERLAVGLIKAEGLPVMDATANSTNSYARVVLSTSASGHKHQKRKSKVVFNEVDPVFNDAWMFQLSQAQLRSSRLTLNLLHIQMGQDSARSIVVGKVVLGLHPGPDTDNDDDDDDAYDRLTPLVESPEANGVEKRRSSTASGSSVASEAKRKDHLGMRHWREMMENPRTPVAYWHALS